MDDVRAWKHPEDRDRAAEGHPAGLVDLAEDLADRVAGGGPVLPGTTLGPLCGTATVLCFYFSLNLTCE